MAKPMIYAAFALAALTLVGCTSIEATKNEKTGLISVTATERSFGTDLILQLRI